MPLTQPMFPPPPPTTNDLTITQRSQLRKSTRKIGKILGTTPRLVEQTYSSITLNLPLSPSAFDFTTCFPKNDSSDSLASPASSCTNSSPLSSASSTRGFFGGFASSNSSTSSVSDFESTAQMSHPQDLWPGLQQPSLVISAQAPPSASRSMRGHYSKSRHARSNSLDGFQKGGFGRDNAVGSCLSLASLPTPDCDGLDSSPPFRIPTTNSLRRRKMEKIRRTLGENVPLELVFPGPEAVTPASRGSLDTKRQPTPVPVPPRQNLIKRVPPPKYDEVAPATDESSPKRAKVLSIILESPNF